jgi:hypothetical protein
MATVTKWTNVAVAMQSAIGAAKAITAISVAAPGVVTATHDFSDGDYVYLEVAGMWQLNGRVFRVCNKSTTVSFQLEDVSGGTGISTVGMDTFSATGSNAYKITFGTSITTATTMSASGGDFDFIDTTTIHSNVKTQIPGTANALSYSFDNLWDIADAGQIAMKAASDAQAIKAFRLTFGTGGKIMTFAGYVGFTGAPTGSAQDKVVTPAAITAFGRPTYYSA